MDSIYSFKDYRDLLRTAFESRSKNGFGEAKKLAEFMGVHPTFISQVLKRGKDLNSEQALTVAEYLNLNELETEYFILLVQIERAGTAKFKAHLKTKLQELSKKVSDLSERVQYQTKISPEDQATFYSDWIYSASRLSTLIPGLDQLDTLSSHLGLPVQELKTVTDFLVKIGMLKLENGKLRTGPLSTHLPKRSPWIKSHHTNWRLKAVESLTARDERALHYTAPMTVSFDDMSKISEILIKSINKIDKIIEPSPSEALVCLCIDWFLVAGSEKT